MTDTKTMSDELTAVQAMGVALSIPMSANDMAEWLAPGVVNHLRALGWELCSSASPAPVTSAPPQEPPASDTPALDALLGPGGAHLVGMWKIGEVRAAYAADTRALRERCERLEAQNDRITREWATARSEAEERAETAERELADARDELTAVRLERDEERTQRGVQERKLLEQARQLEAARAAIQRGADCEGKTWRRIPQPETKENGNG